MLTVSKAPAQRGRWSWWLLWAAVLASALAKNALAHTTSLTTTEIAVSGKTVAFRLRVSAHDLAVALRIETDLVAPVPQTAFVERLELLTHYLGERLIILAQDQPCVSSFPTLDDALMSDYVLLIVHYECPEPVKRLAVHDALFFDIDPAHRNLGQLNWAGGTEPFLFDRLLTHLEWNIAHPLPQPWIARFGRVLILGVEHILMGYDHLLFLLALLIVSARFLQTVKMVSAFTVAHSMTLALAWYGLVDLPSRVVESIIALSIAYVALENMANRGVSHRWLLAGGFGLIHGLGFYGALRNLGLGQTDTVTTLLAFNLGVESGQIVVIALVYGPLLLWRRQSWYQASARACSAVIFLVASWWVVERVLT